MAEIGLAYYDLKNALQSIYDEAEAAAIAHEVLRYLTGMNKLERLEHKHRQLTPELAATLHEMKETLLRGTPLQYAIGTAHFYGRDFQVNPAVLIPRPETEELVHWILMDEQPHHVLDIGTGSGCIAISLALALPACDVLAIDLSEAALDVARENARRLAASVRFESCNFLDAAAQDALPSFDLIVSNPPYIPFAEADSLTVQVREHEPAAALFVPTDDALIFYRAIAAFGKHHLKEGGSIYCEMHRDFANAVTELFQQQGYEHVEVRKDMQGNPRMLQAKRRL